MSPTTFFISLLLAWLVMYIALPTWLILRGWVLSGGLVQLFGALLPGIWHRVLWPQEAGNFGLLIMMLAPLPLGIIAYGLIAGLIRSARRALQFATESRGS